MEKIFRDVSLKELPATIDSILAMGKNLNIWRFEGNLGAGKTTLIKEICKHMGVRQVVQSPTFSIVNNYYDDKGDEIYHFDCYRLKKKEEALDFGFEEYLNSGNLCLIEWPQVVDELLPKPLMTISLEGVGIESRNIGIKLVV